MQFLADLLSALLNATIIGFAVLILVLGAQDDLQDAIPQADLDGAPPTVVAAGDTPRSVIVHLFEWRWDDIAAECEGFLGAAGYGAVQVSPPNEHRRVAGGPWWQRYQPVSYALESRSGDADAFADMVRRCAGAGVKIYADAVINHMTGPSFAEDPLWGVGSAGSPYDYYDYPGLLPGDFHSPRCDVGGRFTDRAAVQRCNLGARADLNTDADRVQNRIGGYLNTLVKLGVAGFRIDAAKHMAAGDIAGVLARVQGLPFVYQAFSEQPGDAVRVSEYLGNGAVTELDYSRRLAAAFRAGDIGVLRNLQPGLGADDLVPGERAVVFVDSHESRRSPPAVGGGTALLSPADGPLYHLANVYMLAWPYGTPRVISGYAFSDAGAGPPTDTDGKTQRVHGPDGFGCGSAWHCEHRHPAIAGMVGFRNHVGDAELANWWNDDGGRIAFGRGERGFVVINNTNEPMRQWLRTGLPAGRYCNAVVSRAAGGACVKLGAPGSDTQDASSDAGGEPAEAVLEVSVRPDRSATFEVRPRAAVAIHVGSQPSVGQ